MSVEEMTIKTKALKDAGIKVLPPTPELKAGLAKIGDTIAAEWEKSAGADGAAMLAAYQEVSAFDNSLPCGEGSERACLDKLYAATLWASALCLVAIALLVGAQLAGRLLDGALALLHLPRTDFVILSLDEICGYLLAGASFLALAGTLKAGAHIRVTMVLGVSERARAPLRRNLGLRFRRGGRRLHDLATWPISPGSRSASTKSRTA